VSGKGLLPGKEHSVKSPGRVHAQDGVVNEDEGGHGGRGLGKLLLLVLGALLGGIGGSDNSGDLALLWVQENDHEDIEGSDDEGRAPVDEEIMVLGIEYTLGLGGDGPVLGVLEDVAVVLKVEVEVL